MSVTLYTISSKCQFNRKKAYGIFLLEFRISFIAAVQIVIMSKQVEMMHAKLVCSTQITRYKFKYNVEYKYMTTEQLFRDNKHAHTFYQMIELPEYFLNLTAKRIEF